MHTKPTVALGALLLTGSLILTGCTQQPSQPTVTPTAYPSHDTKVKGAQHANLYIGYDAYALHVIPASTTPVKEDIAAVLPVSLIDVAVTSYYVQLQDKHGRVVFSEPVTFYQALYLIEKVRGDSLLGGNPEGEVTLPDYPTVASLITALKKATVTDATAKAAVLKEMQPYIDIAKDFDDSYGLDTEPTTPPTAEEQARSQVQQDVNIQVTNMQVGITEGVPVIELAGKYTTKDGTVVTTSSGADGYSFTIVGVDPTGKYVYNYDSASGEVTPAKGK